jgi:S-adenosylmethionine hydrolase
MARPVISFLSDFGARDPSAAICRGIMLGIANDAQIIDISHEVAKFRIRDGAHLLANSVQYLPVGTHVAVVDPGVGTSRRPIAILTQRGDVLVGPDNGLLLAAALRLGGTKQVRVLDNRKLWLQPDSTSSTFHGRDIFAPVAARLATGTAFNTVGKVLDESSLAHVSWPETTIEHGVLRSAVLYIDSFGNAKLGAQAAELVEAVGPLAPGDPLTVDVLAGPLPVPWARTFGDVAVGTLFLFEDSYGWLALSVNQGDAAGRLGLSEDAPIVVRRAASAHGGLGDADEVAAEAAASDEIE